MDTRDETVRVSSEVMMITQKSESCYKKQVDFKVRQIWFAQSFDEITTKKTNTYTLTQNQWPIKITKTCRK